MLLSREKISQASLGRTDAILPETRETEVPGSSTACTGFTGYYVKSQCLNSDPDIQRHHP